MLGVTTEDLEKVQSLFPRRFLFNALLPTLVFGSATSAVGIQTTLGWSRAVSEWQPLDGFSKALLVGGYLAAVWFLSVAVASQWRSIVQLFEGYPVIWLWRKGERSRFVAQWFKDRPVPGTNSHYEERFFLDVEQKAFEIYYRYPRDRDEIMPTRLGNIIRAAENYPLKRYGLRSILFWPRLYPLLPETFQSEFEEYISAYQFPLVVAFEAAIFAMIAGVMLWTTRQPLSLLLASVVPAMLVSIGAYRFSLSPATEWAGHLRVGFDLFRGKLLDAWPTVADVRDEQEAFGLIEVFIAAGDAPGAPIPNWSGAQERRAKRHLAEEPPSPSAASDTQE